MKISQTTDYVLIARLNKTVHDLHVDLYPKYFKNYDFVAVREYFRNIIHNDKFTFLLLEDNGLSVGYAWIEIKDYPESVFREGYTTIYVHQISIQETKRKRGYGSSLMDEIYVIAQNKGITLIELDYWLDNNVAKEFYQKHDFIKQREFVYKDITKGS